MWSSLLDFHLQISWNQTILGHTFLSHFTLGHTFLPLSLSLSLNANLWTFSSLFLVICIVDLSPIFIPGDELKKIFLDTDDVVNLDIELAKFVVKSVAGGYSCHVCGKKCLDKSAARNHVESKHVTTRGHMCPLCHKHVKTKNGLNNHIYRNHKRSSLGMVSPKNLN